MYQSANKQVEIQQIIQGLAITYSRRKESEENNMGKVSVRSALEKKEVVIEPPIDVRVLQRGYFRRKLELMPIVEHDFTDGKLLPDLYKYSYMHEV
uniref:Uncharacterized protein n=2 Tax=Picea TaxID=3328 RepID=A0A101M4D0_PICGL|nr:hypothetical protein ABT39_MTgene712 [Picea glauca]QHR90209.1 hypothetical protein Q903MT_gene4232 [Picea sitchensis]